MSVVRSSNLIIILLDNDASEAATQHEIITRELYNAGFRSKDPEYMADARPNCRCYKTSK